MTQMVITLTEPHMHVRLHSRRECGWHSLAAVGAGKSGTSPGIRAGSASEMVYLLGVRSIGIGISKCT